MTAAVVWMIVALVAVGIEVVTVDLTFGLIAVGGGAAAIAMNKSVTIEVDGQVEQVHTYASTVGELLADEGVNVSEHDSLSPSPGASIGDGGIRVCPLTCGISIPTSSMKQ